MRCVRCVRALHLRSPFVLFSARRQLQGCAAAGLSALTVSLCVPRPIVLISAKNYPPTRTSVGCSSSAVLTQDANREPYELCFLLGRWPPEAGWHQHRWRDETPPHRGRSSFSPTLTIGRDHHHRHHHHGLDAAVTMVMVVTVGVYCLHRRKYTQAAAGNDRRQDNHQRTSHHR